MIKNFLILLFLLSGFTMPAQEFVINGSVPGLENKKVYLMRITGDNRKIIDTVQSDLTGSFAFALEKGFPVGQYAVLAGPGQMVELIFNNEDIRFITTGNTPDDQVQIIESVENLIYYDYLAVKGENLYKLDFLYPILKNYPKEDAFYLTTLSKVRQLQDQLDDRVETLVKENPGALTTKFIQVDRPVFPDAALTTTQQNAYLKSHYFNDTDFLDTLLLNSNMLTGKIIGYLTLYQKQGLSQEQLEEQLIIAVDTILDKAFVDQRVYEFVVDFLIRGFEAIGFEKGLEHIATQNHLEELCTNSDRKKELENKIELIKRLAVGQPAPDFTFTDMSDKSIRLYDLKSEMIVIAFWASWCPHCTAILPALKPFYDPENREKLEIIAVSIDTDETAWKNSVTENQFNWINSSELKGWESEIGNLYGLVATPTFFVLDKNKKIIGKPSTEKELQAILEE
jgi:peroxiredoxin